MNASLKLRSSTGRLINKHFMLVADQLELELDGSNMEMIRAFAEGNVKLYTLARFNHAEYVIHAAGAIYTPKDEEVTFQGWTATLQNGAEMPNDSSSMEMFLTLDSSYFFPRLSEPTHPAKRLPMLLSVKHAA